jgi:fission process protein 1
MGAEEFNADRLRQGPVRLLGYANEVGESFRPLWPRWAVGATYGIAGMYVTADAAWRAQKPPPGTSQVVEAGDTVCHRIPSRHHLPRRPPTPCPRRPTPQFVWQGLASVAVPGAVINRIVWASGQLPLAPRTRAWLPTAVGLACIPFIIKPIDHGVDWFMDTCCRPFYQQQKEKR